ncbi:MAG: 23S rRNA (pseudouridine(1915)-N(3))-methyltransferase RlmH [Eubacteriaceae bacterium]|nr:23S rRNA (pseudouridine(1915)-N(3))-methyltransferase RlmH [Eubacteriaceae bacterium]
MNIKIICIGKLKEKYWTQAAGEYVKRLGAYCRIEIQELKESRSDDINEEGEDILKKIKKEDYVITLEIKGKAFSSEELADKIQQLGIRGHSSLAFVIGGSNGLSERVSGRSDLKLSFSSMTFPHQMMRIILLEQIYRSFKIIKKEKYHK